MHLAQTSARNPPTSVSKTRQSLYQHLSPEKCNKPLNLSSEKCWFYSKLSLEKCDKKNQKKRSHKNLFCDIMGYLGI